MVASGVTGASFSDVGASGGIPMYYVVESACGAPSAEASATTTGICQEPPQFSGLSGMFQSPSSSCELQTQAMASAIPMCPGNSVRYNLYRSTTPGFVPGPSNRIFGGLFGPSGNVDTFGIVPGQTYYYILRAYDANHFGEELNTAYASVTPTSCSPQAPETPRAFSVRAGPQGSTSHVVQWTNAVGGYSRTRVLFRSDGLAPTGPSDPSATILGGSDVAGTPGAVQSFLQTGVSSATYRYAAYTIDAGGTPSTTFQPAPARTSTTSQEMWSIGTGAAALTIPGVYPGQQYGIVSNDRRVYALAPGPSGGSWLPAFTTFQTDGAIGGRPLQTRMAVNRVRGSEWVGFAGDAAGYVHTWDAKSGKRLWMSGALPGPIQASPGAHLVQFGGSFDLIFVPTRQASSPNRVVALNLLDGSEAWFFDNGAGSNAIGPMNGSPAVDVPGSRMFFTSRRAAGGSPHTLWAISYTATSPTPIWDVDIGESDATPILRNGYLYVGNNAGRILKINPADGSVVWTYDVAPADGSVKGLFISGAQIYLSTDTRVHAITDGGGTASAYWTSPFVASNVSVPLVRAGRVYVGAGNSTLYSIDANNPVAFTSLILGDPLINKILGAPTVDTASGLMTIGSDLGVFFAIQLPF